MKLKIILFIIILFILGVVGVFVMINQYQNALERIDSYEDCAAAGYPIMESYPEQCRTPDGRTFTNTPTNPGSAGIWPAFSTQVTLAVNKTATFEDGLAVTLTGINDSRCKPGVVCIWAGELAGEFSATGGTIGSLTEKFVLGTAQIREKTIGGYVFSLDVDKTTETLAVITVKKTQIEQSSNCYIGGCSGQICSDQKDVVSTCEYKSEYACYKTATCERQSTGQCGWTQATALNTCLKKERE